MITSSRKAALGILVLQGWLHQKTLSQVQGQHRYKKKKQEDEDEKENNLINYNLVVMSYCMNKCRGFTHGWRWLVDSGTSFHTTLEKKPFTIYKSGYLGVVKMGNYGKCKIVSIVDVRVVTNMSHTLNLKIVRQVPD